MQVCAQVGRQVASLEGGGTVMPSSISPVLVISPQSLVPGVLIPVFLSVPVHLVLPSQPAFLLAPIPVCFFLALMVLTIVDPDAKSNFYGHIHV